MNRFTLEIEFDHDLSPEGEAQLAEDLSSELRELIESLSPEHAYVEAISIIPSPA